MLLLFQIKKQLVLPLLVLLKHGNSGLLLNAKLNAVLIKIATPRLLLCQKMQYLCSSQTVRQNYGALLVPFTLAYSPPIDDVSFFPFGEHFLTFGATFFTWRDFFSLAPLFFFGATFFTWRDFLSLARLFFFGATFFSLARLFFFGATFFSPARLFSLARLFFLWRDFFLSCATFFLWRSLKYRY